MAKFKVQLVAEERVWVEADNERQAVIAAQEWVHADGDPEFAGQVVVDEAQPDEFDFIVYPDDYGVGPDD